MRKIGLRHASLPAILAFAWWAAGAAIAQNATTGATTQPSAPSGHGDALEEIVVTAEKRASTVQETPISMTAISGDELLAQGITAIASIAEIAPGISMRSSGPGQTEFEMRGLASTGGSAPTVGFYLDESPLTPAAGSLNGKVVVDPSLFDLSRVEVLRGPQGTLYGAGSMGGTIKLVTNAPKLDTFEGEVEGSASGTDGGGFNRGGNLMLNIPIIKDVLAARIVATDEFIDGWIDRIVLNPFPSGTGGNCSGYLVCTRGNVLAAPIAEQYPRSNWERLQALRASLLLKIGEATTVRATGMYQTIYSGGPSQYDDPPGTLAHYQPINQPEPFSDRFSLFSLDLDHRFEFADLTVNGSYYTRRQSNTGDTAEGQESLLGGFFGFTGYYAAPFDELDTTLQRSVEVRLTSTTDAPLQWLVGAFGSDFQSIYEAYIANPVWAGLSAGGAAANPLGIAVQAYNPFHVDQYALFGEGSYKFDNGLKATVGLRWYKYDSDFSYEQEGYFSQSGNASPFFGAVESSATGFNPKFNLAYIPNEDLTVYATVAKGFRPGGSNTPVPAALCGSGVPLNYGPDSIWNYEIGEKARLADSRVSVNADVYYIQWKDIQQYLTIQPCGFTYTGNAGNARAYGPELEISARLVPDVTVTFSGAYTKSEITSVSASAQGTSIAPNQYIAPGQAIENVPGFTVSGSVVYDHPIGASYHLISRILDSYVASSHDVAFYYEELPGYNVINARIGLSNGRFQAYLVGNNLTDKQAELTINTTSFSVLLPSFNRVSTIQPRTIGVDLSYKF